MATVSYFVSGVWNDPRHTTGVRIVKTINLSVNSFLDRGLQLRSMALTYSTVLALVPAIALLVAIGRGFGLSNYLQDELYNIFPSQHRVISTALSFVDSYLNQASSGLFVGVGLVMLLWTVISLLSSIEDAFNAIWDIRTSRSIYRKFTDYLAICMSIPILMICSSGVSLFMSTTVRNAFNLPFFAPFIDFLLELAPLFLSWAAFSISFCFIPNIKVNFKYAAISGAICAIVFQILQMLFANGLVYVSKYNAIYGSFAFLPLFLIWLQLSWMFVLSGCVLTYSLQNVFTYNFLGDETGISNRGWHAVALIVMCVVTRRFLNQEKSLSQMEIAAVYNLPIRLVTRITEKLLEAHLIYYVRVGNDKFGLGPAIEVSTLTVGKFYEMIDKTGEHDFIPDFSIIYKELLDTIMPIAQQSYQDYNVLLLKDLPLPTPEQINEIINSHSAISK